MTLRILPLGNGFALVDEATRQLYSPWFAYQDAAEMFLAFIDRFTEVGVGDDTDDEMELAKAMESFLVGLEACDLGVTTTPAQKLEAFLSSQEWVALWFKDYVQVLA